MCWDRNAVSVLAGLPFCVVREVTETETGSQTCLGLLGPVSSLFALCLLGMMQKQEYGFQPPYIS